MRKGETMGQQGREANTEYKALAEQVPAVVYASSFEKASVRYMIAEGPPRKSEEWFRLLAKATGEAIWDNDLLTGRQEWDGAAGALFGYPSHRGDIGAWWEDRLHPEDKERVLTSLHAVLEGGGEFWSEEYRFRRADGAYATVADRGYVARDGSGRPVRMVGSMADVTEQRRVAEELRQSEQRFRLTFETANVGMAHAAPDGRWLRVNDKLCDILGREREQIMRITFQDLTPPEELAASRERVRRMLAGEHGPYSVERRYIRKDGSRVWVNLKVSLVRKASGEPDYFVCVAEDISRRKLAELIPNPLTPRELEVLKLLSQWRTNKEIAQEINFSESMIKHHVHNILDKLAVKDRRKAVARAIAIGLITPPSQP